GSQYTLFRRDRNERFAMGKEEFVEGGADNLLFDIQASLYGQAEQFLRENTRDASDYEDFKNIAATKKGIIRALWCEDPSCEVAIKEETKASTRCLPFDASEEQGVCVHCERPAAHRWYFAQAY
ncbi:MAG: proline--tRNA ligase, partial [Candidatus Levybacteria bacterium]|nr:proline--tRNA ligase [Candidatus Levybacteria bacterium]